MLSGCTDTSSSLPTSPGSSSNNENLQELPYRDVYSWTRDSAFSSLSPSDQLNKVNMEFYEVEGYAFTSFKAVSGNSGGDIYAIGCATDDHKPAKALIVRYDDNLNIKAYSLEPSDEREDVLFYALVIDNADFVYAVGAFYNKENSDDYGGVVIKYDAELNKLSRLDIPQVFLASIGTSSGDSLFVCGLRNNNKDITGVIAKCSNELVLLESQEISVELYTGFEKLVVDSDDSVYITGWSAVDDNRRVSTAYLLKYSSDLEPLGSVLRSAHNGWEGSNKFFNLVIGKDDSIYVTFNHDDLLQEQRVPHTIIRYSSSLKELGSISVAELPEDSSSNRPPGFEEYRNDIFVRSLAVDQEGFLYCFSTGDSIAKPTISVSLLSDELSVLNTAVFEFASTGDGPSSIETTVSSNGEVFIVGWVAYHTVSGASSKALIVK